MTLPSGMKSFTIVLALMSLLVNAQDVVHDTEVQVPEFGARQPDHLDHD